jgi:hypothetical protein
LKLETLTFTVISPGRTGTLYKGEIMKTAGAGPVAVGVSVAEAVGVVVGEAVGVGGVALAAGIELGGGVAVGVILGDAAGVIDGKLIVEEEQPAKIAATAKMATTGSSLIMPDIL